jgi:riboflavin kinase / FMN adenylyltransferase
VKIYHRIEDFKPVKNAIVTTGTFDGVHLGHQAILKRMIEDAREVDGETVVITFHPHPRIVLHIDSSNLKFISTQKRKIERLEAVGIDNLIIIEFTKAFSRTTSESFIKDFIVDPIKPYKLVVGYDHHFGKNRIGDFKLLYDLGQKFDFKVERLPAQDVENIAVSSTKIRKALEAGDVAKANKLLGYPYSICGRVVRGNQVGRKIGFPTANIETPGEYKLITAGGVYACRVMHDGLQYDGMSNIGVRPTVADGELTIEVNIFDFNKEIYEEEITILFIDRIRDEQKFAGLDELKAQLEKDKEKVKKLLQEHIALQSDQ